MATGTKLVKVRPTDRKSNSSIQAAVTAAEKARIDGALVSARDNAVRYATAAGLTLGTIISVSDAQNSNGGGFFYAIARVSPDQLAAVVCLRSAQPPVTTARRMSSAEAVAQTIVCLDFLYVCDEVTILG